MNSQPDASEIANSVLKQETTAREIVTDVLKNIAQQDSQLNCFTAILAETAIARAEEIDRAIALGRNPGPLAGVPFAVKNLFDLEGITTISGSKIDAENPPALQDATAIARLKQAGAIAVGALNMDEYAYGFVTENSHYGTTRNPHDLSRIAGGSSGGSAAAVAAGLIPFSLGSDTNGSVRVPAALCGTYGFKPTYGRLSRSGAKLFASSLDCIGVFARSLQDIASIYDILQGADPKDPVCCQLRPQYCASELDRGIEGLKIAVADDYFSQGADPEAIAAVEKIAKILNVTRKITIPESDRARAAAYIITAAEGANLHLHNLRDRPEDFDPATRDRFLAGALMPASWYLQAQRFRSWWRDRLREIFQEVDIILAPTTPCVAPQIGQTTATIAGKEILIRPNLGRFTQPLSFIGLPVLSYPVFLPGKLPLGVQIVGAPYKEDLIFRVGAYLAGVELFNK
ncbi:MAG: AtzE family amidohydrolase [Prochloraceae cyanobacterium]|nr:AtzE family amidohydrolase [Prochloraceae cyanobacterium]